MFKTTITEEDYKNCKYPGYLFDKMKKVVEEACKDIYVYAIEHHEIGNSPYIYKTFATEEEAFDYWNKNYNYKKQTYEDYLAFHEKESKPFYYKLVKIHLIDSLLYKFEDLKDELTSAHKQINIWTNQERIELKRNDLRWVEKAYAEINRYFKKEIKSIEQEINSCQYSIEYNFEELKEILESK